MGSLVLLDLMGGVALLLWGLHMVQSGFLRAFGSDLRRFLARGLKNRFSAFGAGLVLTALLQSSTATGLMTASFAAEVSLALVPALAIMLGANLGSAINPVFESGRREDLSSYQLPVGNLINRLVGVVVALPFLPWIASTFQAIEPNASRMTAEFHIAFNVVLALAFIGLLGQM